MSAQTQLEKLWCELNGPVTSFALMICHTGASQIENNVSAMRTWRSLMMDNCL